MHIKKNITETSEITELGTKIICEKCKEWLYQLDPSDNKLFHRSTIKQKHDGDIGIYEAADGVFIECPCCKHKTFTKNIKVTLIGSNTNKNIEQLPLRK